MFEFKAVIPVAARNEDGSVARNDSGDVVMVDETVVLRFRPYGDAPGRISRHNIGYVERQVWEYLEWGLAEPKFWPADSKVPGHNLFDEMPQRQITKCYNEWQRVAMNDDEDEKTGD